MNSSLKMLLLLSTGVFAALVAYICNGLALRPWRRVKLEHWSERARLYFPARTTATSNLLVLPGVIFLSVHLLWEDSAPHWVLIILAAFTGTLFGTFPMDREVFARVSRQDLIRQYVTGSIIRFMLWGVFFTATALMPAQWNLQSFIITIAVLCLLLWWSHDGWLRVGQWLQLIAPPPERLLRITRDTAAKMNIPFRNVWLMRSPFALAYALPSSRSLLLTERLLEILDDNEISGVCAHELAHLSEKKSEHLMRHLIWLYFLPWMFLTPALHCLNIAGFFLLLACSLLIPKIALKISNRLEVRADAIAHANESDPGTYARALAKLYEDNLTPAVNSKKQTTHPHLYDRLLAAGVTPDFPRPVPAEDLSPHGTFFSSALGFLAVIAVFKLLNII